MNIKQKLTWAFLTIASVPVIAVAIVVILNVRGDAQRQFIDSSSREIRQVENAMNLFFEGIEQNVAYLAAPPGDYRSPRPEELQFGGCSLYAFA